MALTNIATLTFADPGSSDEAVVIVRAGRDTVGLCLSLLHDGDTEVFLSVADARQVLAALEAGIAAAEQAPEHAT